MNKNRAVAIAAALLFNTEKFKSRCSHNMLVVKECSRLAKKKAGKSRYCC